MKISHYSFACKNTKFLNTTNILSKKINKKMKKNMKSGFLLVSNHKNKQ